MAQQGKKSKKQTLNLDDDKKPVELQVEEKKKKKVKKDKKPKVVQEYEDKESLLSNDEEKESVNGKTQEKMQNSDDDYNVSVENAHFLCDIFDGYSFRQALEFFKIFSPSLVIQAYRDFLRIESSDIDRNIVGVLEIFAYNLTEYVYKSNENFINIGLSDLTMKSLAKSIQRNECVRMLIKSEDSQSFMFCKVVGNETRDNNKIQNHKALIPRHNQYSKLINRNIKSPNFVIESSDVASLFNAYKSKINNVELTCYENGITLTMPNSQEIVNKEGYRGKRVRGNLLTKVKVSSTVVKAVAKIATLSQRGQVKFYIQQGGEQVKIQEKDGEAIVETIPMVRMIVNVGNVGTLSIYLKNADSN